MKWLRKLFARITMRVVLTMSVLMTLVGLALMVWSMLDPTPLPVILAMSVGQGLGILAFAMFGGVALVDQLRKQRRKGAVEAAAAVAATASIVQGPVVDGPASTSVGDLHAAAAVPADGASARPQTRQAPP
jgi:hypothetical protein